MGRRNRKTWDTEEHQQKLIDKKEEQDLKKHPKYGHEELPVEGLEE